MIDPEVQAEVHARGITRVCHFTEARNLPHILGDARGIIATASLAQNKPDILNANDPQRLDGKRGHISCSIEYPNSWNFKQFRNRQLQFPDWVVLLIDPSVLWLASTVFSPRNAAAGSHLHRKGIGGFRAMYETKIAGAYGKIYKRQPGHLAACPTDGQAEVLVEGNIPRDRICGVAAISDQHAAREKARLSMLDGIPHLPWIVAPSFYNASWHAAIVNGRRPDEHLYIDPASGADPHRG